MSIILDTEEHIFIAETRAELAQQLLEFLDDDPDDATLTDLAATVLGCMDLDVIITYTDMGQPRA